MLDFFAQVRVEFVLILQLLQGEVHAVAPVVARVCGHVDLLLTRVLATDMAVDGEPVLQGQDAEHRG